MISATERDKESVSLKLDGDLTIYVANKFNQEINEFLKKYECIDVDMSGVTEFDTSCYQILLRAKLLSIECNKILVLGDLSNECQQVFDMYNLESVFSA